jgi:hypothetical protein
LGELARLPNVTALAFHVDYWDSIGWHDRFSLPEAAQRQRRYVEALRLSSSFTPEVVIDGRRNFVGSDRSHILAALTEPLDTIPIAVEIAQGALIVKVPERAVHSGYDLDLVAYVPETSTSVTGGENSGRALREFNIAREFRRLGVWNGQQSVYRVPVESFPRDATRVAILLQHSRQGLIVGSASVSLR